MLSEHLNVLERILDNIYGMVAILDPDMNFVRVNAAYAEADNKKPQDFTGKNHFEFYPDKENERIFYRVVESGEPYVAYSRPFEYPDHPERGVTYWDWTLSPLRDESGEIEGLLLSLSNVTERVVGELERLEAEKCFHTLFDNLSDAVFIHDMRGRFLEVNSAACERLGYRKRELLDLSVKDIDTPEMARLAPENIAVLMEEGRLTIETEHVCKDGSTIPTELNARLIEFEGQQAVLSIARDITERKRAEERLRESERNANALLNAIRESALLMEVDGTVLAINETGALRMGQKAGEVVGTNVYELLSEEVAESRKALTKQIVKSGQPFHSEDQRDAYVFDTSIYPVKDDAGEVARLAIYAKDITHERLMQAVDDLLHSIDSRVLTGQSLDMIMQYICSAVVTIFDYQLAWIGKKLDDGSIEVVSSAGEARGYHDELIRVGIRWDDTPQGRGPAGSAISSGELKFAKLLDGHFKPWREAAQHHGLNSLIALPLLIQGEVYGVLAIYSSQLTAFDDQGVVEMLNGVANRLRVALEHAMDHENIRLLSSALAAAGNGVLITDRHGTIEWVNDAFCRMSGYKVDEMMGEMPSILKSGIQDSDYYAALWSTILSGERWAGETVEQHKNGENYTVRQTITPILDEQGEISHFIAIHEDITLQKATEARIQYLAHHDPLTSLPNRALFYDRLKRSIASSKRESRQFALLFLDLDRFKEVNDTLGHAVGDQLLQEVSRRLNSCVRESDTVARLGGDEFTVILCNIRDRAAVEGVAQKIIKTVAEPYQLDQHTVYTSTSIGIALYPEHGQDEDELVQAADMAMYLAKREVRGIFRFAGK